MKQVNKRNLCKQSLAWGTDRYCKFSFLKPILVKLMVHTVLCLFIWSSLCNLIIQRMCVYLSVSIGNKSARSGVLWNLSSVPELGVRVPVFTDIYVLQEIHQNNLFFLNPKIKKIKISFLLLPISRLWQNLPGKDIFSVFLGTRYCFSQHMMKVTGESVSVTKRCVPLEDCLATGCTYVKHEEYKV